MASYNKVMLMGNLTRDIELRYTPSNQPVAKIGLAINRNYTTKEGERREETTFVDCEAWGRTAEVMNQYLSKGKPVFVEGRLKLDSWQDRESGQNRSKLLVVIDTFQFIDSKGGGQGGGQQGAQGQGAQGQGAQGQGAEGGGYQQQAPAPHANAGVSGGAPAGAQGGAPAPVDPGHQPVTEDDIPF